MGCTSSNDVPAAIPIKKEPNDLQQECKIKQILLAPEPQDKSDVTLVSKNGDGFEIHSVLLSYRSLVFRNLDWSTHRFMQTNHTSRALMAFVNILYLPEHVYDEIRVLTVHDLLDLWYFCFEYALVWKNNCASHLQNKLASVNSFECVEILHMAQKLNNKDIIQNVVGILKQKKLSLEVLNLLTSNDKSLLLL